MSYSEELFVSGVLAGYAVTAYSIWKYVKWRRLEREKKEKEFVAHLISALQNDALKKFDDVEDLYIGFFKGKETDTLDAHRLSVLLKQVKLSVSSETIRDESLRSNYLTTINDLLEKGKEREQEQRAKAPFSGVPSPERSLLDDVREVSGAKDNPFIQDKLIELASAIKIRQETVEVLGEEKGRSLKWAKWGLFGTVFFSLLSIGITYYFSTKGLEP